MIKYRTAIWVGFVACMQAKRHYIDDQKKEGTQKTSFLHVWDGRVHYIHGSG